MPNFFNYNFPVIPNSQTNPNGNLGTGNPTVENIPPKTPESYFFMEPVLSESQNTKAFGSLGDKEFQVTTTFNSGTTKVKAFAVTSGTLFFAQHGDSTDRVNIFLKPNKDIGLGVKIKYFVYRGVKAENIFRKEGGKLLLIKKPEVNILDFLKPVWDDYVEFNATDQDFTADKIGYLNSGTTVEEMLQMFFATEKHSLLHVSAGMHIGNFEGDFGFEIILDQGDFTQKMADSGLDFNDKFASATECILKTNGANGPYIFGGNTNAAGEKIFRENLYHFLDPAAFYGSHVTDTGNNMKGGKIKVKNGTAETSYQKPGEVYSNVVSKLKNKNKIYLYIKGTRGRSYNFYNAQIKPVKIAYKNDSNQPTELTEFNVDKWPIQVFSTQGGYVFITFELLKLENNSAFFYTGIGAAGRLYDDSKLVYPQNAGTFIKLGVKVDLPTTGSSLIYAAFAAEEEESNRFGPVNLETIFEEEDFSEFNKISWVNHLRPVLMTDKNQSALYNTKIIIDKSDALVEKQYRTYLLEPLSDTLQPDLYSEKLKPSSMISGYSKIDIDKTDSKSFCKDVLDINGAEIWRGEMKDGATTVKSFALRKDENVYTTDRYVLGITEKEYKVLMARVPASAKSPNCFIKFGNNATTGLDQFINFAKYPVQIEYDDNNAQKQVTTTPSGQTDIYLYTIDGLFFFTKLYSDSFPYYSEFAETTVEFRPGNDWMKYFNYPLQATKTVYGKPEVLYGFDWLRKGDSEITPSYRIYDRPFINITGANLSTDPNDLNQFSIKRDIYYKVKRLYRSIPLTWKLDDGQSFDSAFNPTNKELNDSYDKDFAPSWLNIPRNQNGNTLPVKLRVKIRSKTVPASIKLYYNNQLFKINKLGTAGLTSIPLDSKDIKVSLNEFSSDSIGVLKFNSSDLPTTAKTLKWIDFELENISPINSTSVITVMADGKLAGKLYITPNNTAVTIKKDVLITKIKYSGRTGEYDNHEIELLKIFAKQNNIEVNVKMNGDLDLTNDNNFQQFVNPTNNKIDVKNTKSIGGKDLHVYEYLSSLVNDANSVKIFIVKQQGSSPGIGVMGFTLEKPKFILMYSEFKQELKTDDTAYFTAIAHEFLHSQGLPHTFAGKIDRRAFITLADGNTNNVMDYSNAGYKPEIGDADTGFVQGTFFWQWGIARQEAKKN